MTSVTTSSSLLRRRTRKKSRALPAGIAIVVLGGLAWWGWQRAHSGPNPFAQMITATVTRGDLTETISATGSISPQTGAEVKIGSQITGTIKKLHADVGSLVHAGDIIAELDLPDIRAQLGQSEANLAAARTKLTQQISGVPMVQTQSRTAVDQARANLRSMQARLNSAQADASLQYAQTPTDIDRAKTTLSADRAALSTAQSNQKQVQAGANLQVSTAQEQLAQAQANAKNAQLNLQRQQALLARGYVAQSDVDTAQATSDVDAAQVSAAQQNVELVKQKVTADLQSAQDQVTQAQQNVQAAQAALTAANAETFSNRSKAAAVLDAQAAVRQAQANLSAAQANTVNDLLKQQDIQQARDAVSQASDQVAYSQAQVNKTIIRTPITGTVLQLASQQGETLAAGLSAPTLIIVCDLSRLQVDAYVDETDIGKVKLGQDADITVDAFPRHTFRGTVTKIASGSTIQSGVVTYDVTIAIRENPRFRLKPDMTASVTIRTGTRTNVLLVPSEAIKLAVRGSTVDLLTIKDGQKAVVPTPVRTGASDGVNTEILHGLNEGDTVVLAGATETSGRHFGPQNPFGPQQKRTNTKAGGH